MSDHYADVHLSLLPSSILLGPNALRERRSAADDGAGNVFVTAGSLRKALRHAGVLLGDTDDRVVSCQRWCFFVACSFDSVLLILLGDANDRVVSWYISACELFRLFVCIL